MLGALWLARAGWPGTSRTCMHLCSRRSTRSSRHRRRWPRSTPTRPTASTWPPRRPPGDHARLLGLGQGRRLPHEPVGDLPRPGAAGGAGARARDRGHLLPRPRRLALARRRPPTRRSSPSRRVARRRRPDHRAGRGDLGQVRRPRAGRALAGAAGVGAPARPRRPAVSVPAEFRDEIDRAASRSCGGYRDLVDGEGFVEFFRRSRRSTSWRS